MNTPAAAFSCLATKSFWAFVADNSALGIHEAGLNGVASLVPRAGGNNLFTPWGGGMNYEIITLADMPPFQPTAVSPFEPRSEPMHLAHADAREAVLVQPETSHSHVGARITFRVREPHYLYQRIELTFHRRFCPPGGKNTFHSLWANYIHMPPDRHVYVKKDWSQHGEPFRQAQGPEFIEGLDNWTGITKLDHGPADWHLRPLSAEREISPAEHLQAMRDRQPEVFWYGPVPPTDPLTLGREVLPGPLTFYYGLVHELLFLMMFRQPERFRFAYSPCGGGKEPAWCPAWDYVLFLEDARLDHPYVWDLCLVVKPYEGRRDVLAEVRRYLERW